MLKRARQAVARAEVSQVGALMAMNKSRSSREYLSFVCTHALQLSKHLCSPMHRRASRRNITRCRQGALVTVACARGFGEDHYLSTSKLKDKLICLCFRNFFILVHAPFSFSFSILLSSSSLSCAFALLVPTDLAHPVHLFSKQAADIYTPYGVCSWNAETALFSFDLMIRCCERGKLSLNFSRSARWKGL